MINLNHIPMITVALLIPSLLIIATWEQEQELTYPRLIEVNAEVFGEPTLTEQQCLEQFNVLYEKVSVKIPIDYEEVDAWIESLNIEDESFFMFPYLLMDGYWDLSHVQARHDNKEQMLAWGENCYWIENGLKMTLDLDSIDDAVELGFTDEDKIRDGCWATVEHSICYGQVWIDRHANYFRDGFYTYD